MSIDAILYVLVNKYLWQMGAVLLILILVFILLGTYLYKKSKKWLCALSLIPVLFFVSILYYFMTSFVYLAISEKNPEENANLIKFVQKIAIPRDSAVLFDINSALNAWSALEFGRIVTNEQEHQKLIDTAIYYFSQGCFAYDYADLESCYDLSRVYSLLGKYDEAIYLNEYTTNLIKNEKKYSSRYVLRRNDTDLIRLYILNKDYNGAIKALNIYHFDDDIKTIYKAEIYRRTGKPEQALKILNAYITNTNPKHYDYKTFAFRALAHMDLGQIKQAKQDYEKAKEYNRYYKRLKTFEEFIEEAKIENMYNEKRKRKGIVLEN